MVQTAPAPKLNCYLVTVFIRKWQLEGPRSGESTMSKSRAEQREQKLLDRLYRLMIETGRDVEMVIPVRFLLV